MRIVSLLPSLTELVAALGREGDLVGVTHECDVPPGVEALPHLTISRIPTASSSAEIDRLVAEQGGSLYDLDADLLAQARPDLILTQAQCDVCAVNERTVLDVASTLPGPPQVEVVNPMTLDGVFSMFRRVGDRVGRRSQAEELIAAFESVVAQIAFRRQGRPTPRVLHLEWTDPPYRSGHWNPEIIRLAGGEEVLGASGEPSRRVTWEEIRAAKPEVALIAPCGYPLERVEEEWRTLRTTPQWRAVSPRTIALIDGSAFFSRPGPRLEASLRIAAAAIDPERCGDLAPSEGWRLVLEAST
jgi:iron complex transport system substrate-binding protein